MASSTQQKQPESIPAALADFDRLPTSSLITVDVVAALFGYSRNHVWRLARSGRLPAPIKIGPKSTRWRVGDVRAALAAIVGEGQ